jgi:hypothetical protein
MHDLIARSPNAEALRAELHRNDLFREAAASRLARSASLEDSWTTNGAVSGLIRRIRTAIGSVGQPARPDCPECA